MEPPVYMILYIVIGLLGVSIILIFCVYHTLLRIKKPKPSIIFLSYIKPLYLQPLYGLFLSAVPVSIFMSLSSILMIGEWFEFKILIENDTIFNQILKYLNLNNDKGLNSGRAGASIAFIGTLLSLKCIEIFVPVQK